MKAPLQVEAVIEAHAFVARDFIGGDAALDFVNTVTGRDRAPRDWLDGYARLLEWSAAARLLPPRTLGALKRNALAAPRAAAEALARAKVLREAMFAIVAAVVDGTRPPKGALALVRTHWIAGVEAHELRGDGIAVRPELRDDADDLDLPAAIVARRLVEDVVPLPRERLRICQGPSCSWLYIDRSKAGRRRWCDMAVCGNAAKSRRFQARRRRGSARGDER